MTPGATTITAWEHGAVDVARLLENLCVRLGYCLPPEAQQSLVAAPPQSIDAFTNAVIRAEGRDPILVDNHSWRQVRAIVAEAFGQPQQRPRRRRPGRGG